MQGTEVTNRLAAACAWMLVLITSVSVELALLGPWQPTWRPLTWGFAYVLIGFILRGQVARLSYRAMVGWMIAALLFPSVESWVAGAPWDGAILRGYRNLAILLVAVPQSSLFRVLCILLTLYLSIGSSMELHGVWSVLIVSTYAMSASCLLAALALGGATTNSVGAPVASLVAVLLVIGSICATFAMGPRTISASLQGWFSSSGGAERGHEMARSGVGDGPDEVRGSRDARSLGFDDSDVFVESDRPTLYDTFIESFGAPVPPSEQSKLLALKDPSLLFGQKSSIENMRAGRTFALRRDAPSRRTEPQARTATSLLYVKGSTPLHIPMVVYDHLEAGVWHEARHEYTSTGLDNADSQRWLVLAMPPQSRVLRSQERFVIRVASLDCDVLPIPPHMSRFRMGRIDRADFFARAHEGLYRMVKRKIPPGSVFEVDCGVVCPEALRTSMFSSTKAVGISHERIVSLADELTQGTSRGYEQIQAVVAWLKEHFEYDTSIPYGDSTTPVLDFLDRRRGASYHFATACAVLLSHLQYEVRLVGGFYASPRKYDQRSESVPVGADDAHFWCEVRLSDGTWVTVEPTPGYGVLQPKPDFNRAFRDALLRTALKLKFHAASVGMIGIAAFWQRRRLLPWCDAAIWLIRSARGSRERVLATLRFLERQIQRVGHPRPIHVSLRRWVAIRSTAFAQTLKADIDSLLRCAERLQYGPPGSDSLEPDLSSVCKRIIWHHLTAGRESSGKRVAR
jgi:transglutaminase-like putative cysteine protease